jgi:hypothetical protein
MKNLLDDISALIQTTGVSLEYRQYEAAGITRHEWTRRLGGDCRYLRIAPVLADQRTWDYEMLGGLYNDSGGGFDGRRGGSRSYVLDIFRRWLVDLEDWDDLEPFVPRQDGGA